MLKNTLSHILYFFKNVINNINKYKLLKTKMNE